MKIKRIEEFGTLAKNYEKGRNGYPPEVFQFLKKTLNTKKPLILDLGCGTGISTRQLTQIGTVVGCDRDVGMIKYAKKRSMRGIVKYVLGSAYKLPFSNETFDAVTAFTAFHWFDNAKSIREIKRVLKPKGVFMVVGKSSNKEWGEYRQAIIKSIKKHIAPLKRYNYNHEKTLKKFKNYGFRQLRAMSTKVIEFYSLAKAVDYAQSVSTWHSVPESLRPKAIEGLNKYYKSLLKNNKIERKTIVRAVSGSK